MEVPNHKATVATVRDKYGPMPTADECVEICNEVAWIHRADGFGVAEKTAGTRGQRHDGQLCAIDGLVFRHKDGSHVDQFVDILVGADNATPPRARPGWDVKDTSNRKWVAPIQPPGTPTPPPDPGPDDYVTRTELQAALAAYDKTVEQRLASMRDEFEDQIVSLSNRVTALEQAPPGDLVLVADAAAPPVSTSSASLSLTHRHELRARVVTRTP